MPTCISHQLRCGSHGCYRCLGVAAPCVHICCVYMTERRQRHRIKTLRLPIRQCRVSERFSSETFPELH